MTGQMKLLVPSCMILLVGVVAFNSEDTWFERDNAQLWSPIQVKLIMYCFIEFKLFHRFMGPSPHDVSSRC